jgi:hypothetical protein
MRADVFQVVALCCHADAYLNGGAERTPELISNSTFLPVHEVVFQRTGTGKLASGIVADAPGPWLRRLNKESVERLSLSLAGCPFDPLTPAGEPWGIVTDGDVGVEIWQPVWRKRIRTYGDNSPWHVTYTSARASRWSTPSPFKFTDLEKLLSSLVVHVVDTHPTLQPLFASEAHPFPDLFPDGWPEKSRKLGNAAARIGAIIRSDEWAQILLKNELPAGDHEAISQQLWKATLMALEASAKGDCSTSGRLTESALVEHPTAHTTIDQILPMTG